MQKITDLKINTNKTTETKRLLEHY